MKDTFTSKDWWEQLETQWKQAFAAAILKHENEPTTAELDKLFALETVRLAGPTAPFTTVPFELTNLSGLTHLQHLSILIITHHKIENIEILSGLPNLSSLFLFNNNIKSLHGIESLFKLQLLYVQHNQISSIKPVEKLTCLKELYINDNRITSLDGLTEDHSDKLRMFMCRPNEQLKQKEIIRVERELGIICRSS